MNTRPFHQRMLPGLLGAILLLAGGYALRNESSAAPTHAVPIASTPFGSCSTTLPNGNTPPGEHPSSLDYGNGKLWTNLWPEGVVLMLPERDYATPGGPFAMKWGWWRGVTGQLTVMGRRLDGAAPPLTASIPDGYGDYGFQSTSIIFPTAGCWEVTGRAGDASLTFVTRVVEIREPAMTTVAAAAAASASPLAICSVTLPNGQTPRSAVSYPGWHREGDLWVGLSSNGTETHPTVSNLRDGAIASAWDWWRGSSGTLVIEGRRLDGAAPALGAVVPAVYGETGYQATVLFFPTPGCWEVTGRVGKAALRVVVQVVVTGA